MVTCPRLTSKEITRSAFDARRPELERSYKAALGEAMNHQFPNPGFNETDNDFDDDKFETPTDGFEPSQPLQPAAVVTFTILGTPFLGWNIPWAVEAAGEAVRDWFNANPNAHNVIRTIRFIVPSLSDLEQHPQERRAAWIKRWK